MITTIYNEETISKEINTKWAGKTVHFAKETDSMLSDLFFVMARYEMQQQNWTEEKWQSFAYKRKKKE